MEVWQANACGRYRHAGDQHPAPLDPNFEGVGRCVTDDEGRYRFITIKPGAYPWGNHPNAWRPQHIHFSVFGRALTQRLVTQMYFPGDPLFEYDPIFNSVRDEQARRRMICAFDLSSHQARLGARLPLRHRAAGARRDPVRMSTTPAADRRPVLRRSGCRGPTAPTSSPTAPRARSGCAGRVLDGARDPIPDAMIETWQADPDGSYETPASAASGAARPTRTAAGRSARSSRARPAARRRTSPSRSSPAGCCTASSRASTSPTRRRPTPPTRCWRARRGGARHADRRARGATATASTCASKVADETAFFAV